MINKLQNIKIKVKELLQKFPHLRDSDAKLIATIYYHEANLMTDQLSAMQLLKLFSDGKLSSPESIRRIRQKLQYDYPELRGKSYVVRQSMEKDVRQNINNI